MFLAKEFTITVRKSLSFSGEEHSPPLIAMERSAVLESAVVFTVSGIPLPRFVVWMSGAFL